MFNTDDILEKSAEQLVKTLAYREMDKIVDKHLPQELSNIVKLHSKIAAGAGFIPLPGAGLVVAAGNIWTMYGRINSKLNIPFSENLIKSIGTGFLTNLGSSYLGGLVIGTIFKFIPFAGSVMGGAVVAAVVYGLTLASGVIYFKTLTILSQKENLENVTKEELSAIINQVAEENKDIIDTIVEESKKTYKDEIDRKLFRDKILELSVLMACIDKNIAQTELKALSEIAKEFFTDCNDTELCKQEAQEIQQFVNKVYKDILNNRLNLKTILENINKELKEEEKILIFEKTLVVAAADGVCDFDELKLAYEIGKGLNIDIKIMRLLINKYIPLNLVKEEEKQEQIAYRIENKLLNF